MQLFNGDCSTVLSELIQAGVTVDTVIMDPPYELDTHGGGES